MRLRNLTEVAPIAVWRDAEFKNLGLLSCDLPALFACLYEGRALQRDLPANTNLTCLLTTPQLAPLVPAHLGLVVAADPVSGYYTIHEHLRTETDFYGRDFETEVSPTAVVSSGAWIAEKNVRIGAGTQIEPNVTVLEGSLIGENVTIRAGTVIGAEGFSPKELGGAVKNVPHAGAVRIRDGVEILSNCVVCRSVFRDSTEIGEETIIGNLVHVSHSVRIGQRCRIGASAVLSGSTRLGDRVWVGPGAVISNRIRLGDETAVTLGSVVVRDVAAGKRVSGNFALEHARFLDSYLRKMR
jgi:acyl-[acyl carrier protein]--UDP-N-acetylglucosamine O-acyltransferase